MSSPIKKDSTSSCLKSIHDEDNGDIKEELNVPTSKEKETPIKVQQYITPHHRK